MLDTNGILLTTDLYIWNGLVNKSLLKCYRLNVCVLPN